MDIISIFPSIRSTPQTHHKPPTLPRNIPNQKSLKKTHTSHYKLCHQISWSFSKAVKKALTYHHFYCLPSTVTLFYKVIMYVHVYQKKNKYIWWFTLFWIEILSWQPTTLNVQNEIKMRQVTEINIFWFKRSLRDRSERKIVTRVMKNSNEAEEGSQ